MAARKLKVFQAQFGFYDSVVAAPSQAAALKAWGTHQNLFATGEAKAATDEAAITVAMAHPETPLRRAVGSSGAFAIEPDGLPKVPDDPKRAGAKPSAKSKPVEPAAPTADRSKLDAAETALRNVEEQRKAEEATFRNEEDALANRRAAAQSRYVDVRKMAVAKVNAARTAYANSGGVD